MCLLVQPAAEAQFGPEVRHTVPLPIRANRRCTAGTVAECLRRFSVIVDDSFHVICRVNAAELRARGLTAASKSCLIVSLLRQVCATVDCFGDGALLRFASNMQ